MRKGIDVIIEVLSSKAEEALRILSIPDFLQDSLAKKLLVGIMKIDDKSASIFINELRNFPIWHERTINSWVLDDDIREYVSEKLEYSDIDTRLKAIEVMVEFKKCVSLWEQKDYDLQIARLMISLEQRRKEGIHIFRQIFDLAFRFDQVETERIIDLYLDRMYPEPSPNAVALSEEEINAYFIRGLYAYKINKFDTALNFFYPLGKLSDLNLRELAESSYFSGIILKEKLDLEKAENAYKKSLELFRKINDLPGQVKVLRSLSELLSNIPARLQESETFYTESIKFEANPHIIAQAYLKIGNALSCDKFARNIYKQSCLFRNKLLKEQSYDYNVSVDNINYFLETLNFAMLNMAIVQKYFVNTYLAVRGCLGFDSSSIQTSKWISQTVHKPEDIMRENAIVHSKPITGTIGYEKYDIARINSNIDLSSYIMHIYKDICSINQHNYISVSNELLYNPIRDPNESIDRGTIITECLNDLYVQYDAGIIIDPDKQCIKWHDPQNDLIDIITRAQYKDGIIYRDEYRKRYAQYKEIIDRDEYNSIFRFYNYLKDAEFDYIQELVKKFIEFSQLKI